MYHHYTEHTVWHNTHTYTHTYNYNPFWQSNFHNFIIFRSANESHYLVQILSLSLARDAQPEHERDGESISLYLDVCFFPSVLLQMHVFRPIREKGQKAGKHKKWFICVH